LVLIIFDSIRLIKIAANLWLVELWLIAES
jgi:hypothetical protein